MDPFQIRMFQRFGSSLRDGTVKQTQPDVNIGVFVDHLCKQRSYGNGDIQFFTAFTDQRGLHGFIGLHFTADEFPQKSAGFVGGALADHEAVMIPDQCGNDFDHLTSFSSSERKRRLRRRQLRQRHQQGLEVALSVLSDLSGEEMSHVTAVFHRQTGPVNEQALKDCIRIIKSEYSAANVSSADDLMAFRNKLRESKGVQG